ncbi:MAG TPA: NAD(P)/FAD-dependent oxidoreductase [Fimbriimonadaceae bacterium]|jgi:flavin-dependent dehydrogenase
METITTDVAIIGAGPGGTTCGGFLRKYDPSISVTIFEREVFPRDHIGESQLPALSAILDELGVWDDVEACNFPVKIGGTYRWGNSDDLWDFDFLPYGQFEDVPRPSKFEGQRLQTAFQVDRSIYDKLLSDHAEKLGCDIRFNTSVRSVEKNGDRVESLTLNDGTKVKAKHYVDASGHVGILRRAMGVEIEEPSALKNIAIWDYWRNAEWAVSLGIGGTRIQILSLGYGWIWFIPISPDRTSIGFVCPADYYKKSGLTIEKLYENALNEEPLLRSLIANAKPEGNLSTTKDWSFVAERMTGENWSLVGESGGFADPILSAGMTLTQVSAREMAYILLEERRGADTAWMIEEYERRNKRRLTQHIRFADYWYKANAHFSDLQEYTAEIAKDAGLNLSAQEAFRWLGTGGFAEEDMQSAGFSLIRIDQLHQIAARLSDCPPTSALDGFNQFKLKLEGAKEIQVARFENGKIFKVKALERDGKMLPYRTLFEWMIAGLRHSPRFETAMAFLASKMPAAGFPRDRFLQARLIECLDAMVRDGWVEATLAPAMPVIRHDIPPESTVIRKHVD